MTAARGGLEQQAEALRVMAARLDTEFVQVVDCLLAVPGRVVVTGVGKSGVVGRKLASTLASTGTPSFFLHATEALHGDLGMVTPDDAVLLVSCSGQTNELLQLLPHLVARGVLTVGLLGELASPIARQVDLVLDASVSAESCPLGVVPTTSTVAAMALGDALALGVMAARGFGAAEFAQHHPGGALGARLRGALGEALPSLADCSGPFAKSG